MTRPLLVIAIAAMLAGCGSDSGGGTADDAATTAAVAEPDRSADLAAIREDFEFNFSSTSWFTPAETLSIEGSTLEAHTDWYVDDEGRMLGEQLCNALAGNYVRAHTATYGLDHVRVFGGNGDLLASCG